MKTLISIPVVCALSLGSAIVSAADAVRQVDPNAANLVIYRPQESNNSTYYRISVDGQHIGKLKRGRSINLKLPAGEHIISANDKNRTQQKVSVADGGTVTFVKNEIDRRQRLSFEVQTRNGQGDLTASLQ